MVGGTLVVVCGFLITAAPAIAASTEKVLYSFCSINDCTDGSGPDAGLLFDAAGNLYGTTASGGAYGYGTVFQLTPSAGGTWTETVLYSFCSLSNCTDGVDPVGTLIFDAVGNLYGMTQAGGAYGASCGGFGCGTVFELIPDGNGTWTETVLHSFDDDGMDGWEPTAGLVLDSAGNLYGTTLRGGQGRGGDCGGFGCGTVFELSPNNNGTWTESVLHNFCYPNGCANGAKPQASLILDSSGNLYGTATYGGSSSRCGAGGCGVVFQLTPSGKGGWKEKTLYSFDRNNGEQPRASLIFGETGLLYGTTYLGGTYRYGTAFRLTLGTSGKWTEKVLHNFGKGTDGYNPEAGLIFDTSGRLCSTTDTGGVHAYGTVFQLTPSKNGTWSERVLHSFNKNGTDGFFPNSLILDTSGNLYSTTKGGGASGSSNGGGTVFEIMP